MQLVEWAGQVDRTDPVVHTVRSMVYGLKAKSELSLMAQGVYLVRKQRPPTHPPKKKAHHSLRC